MLLSIISEQIDLLPATWVEGWSNPTELLDVISNLNYYCAHTTGIVYGSADFLVEQYKSEVLKSLVSKIDIPQPDCYLIITSPLQHDAKISSYFHPNFNSGKRIFRIASNDQEEIVKCVEYIRELWARESSISVTRPSFSSVRAEG